MHAPIGVGLQSIRKRNTVAAYTEHGVEAGHDESGPYDGQRAEKVKNRGDEVGRQYSWRVAVADLREITCLDGSVRI